MVKKLLSSLLLITNLSYADQSFVYSVPQIGLGQVNKDIKILAAFYYKVVNPTYKEQHYIAEERINVNDYVYIKEIKLGLNPYQKVEKQESGYLIFRASVPGKYKISSTMTIKGNPSLTYTGYSEVTVNKN